MTLIIVESPTKAKKIGKFLGKKYKVVASNGHIRDLPKSTLGVDVEHDFTPKYITLRGRGAVLEMIKKEAKGTDKVLLATDPDREGEAISWHLAHVLKIADGEKCRIVFNEITQKAIKNSLEHPRVIDRPLVDAQQARRVLDRLVGYSISPVLWAKVRKGLSAGRVQSVAARIICDREEEILSFIPEEYWTISAELKEQHISKPVNAKFYGFNGKKTEIHTEEEANVVLEKSKQGDFTVSDVKKTVKNKRAPAPFTTSSLQQEAGRKLGFTTKHTMLVAQQLYEGAEFDSGLVTYIRTDSVRVAAEAQENALSYIKGHYGKEYAPEKPNFYKGRKDAQDAHEAIRPTNMDYTPAFMKDKLTPTQYKLYKLVFERFLASQMTDAITESTTVTLGVNGCTYKLNGMRTIFDGFTAIYTEGRDDVEEKTATLPEINEGDSLKLQKLTSEQKFTQPPTRYTEAALVRTLEELGIGRPSTYAPTIFTILERGYIKREKKLLIPTDLGFVVTKLMKENFKNIVDLRFTADMEQRLDSVEDGKENWTNIIREFYFPFEETVEQAKSTIEKVIIPDEVSDIPCEKCGAMMVYKMGRYGRFLACPNFPECKSTKAIVEKIGVKCPSCGADIIKRKSKRGKLFYGCEKYPECSFVSWEKPTGEKCEKCGAFMVVRMGKKGACNACSNKDCGKGETAKEEKND